MKIIKILCYFILGFFINVLYLGIIGVIYKDIDKLMNENALSVSLLFIAIPLLLHAIINNKYMTVEWYLDLFFP